MIRKACLAALTALSLLAATIEARAYVLIFFPPTDAQPRPFMPPLTQEYGSIRTVAIVFAIGQSLTVDRPRFLASATRPTDISAWNLDDDGTALLKRLLAGRFKFKDIAYDRAALAALPPGDTGKAYRAYLDTLNTDGIDAFIVIRPDLEARSAGSAGLSLTHASTSSDRRPALWANYEIDIVQASSGTLIGKAYSRLTLRLGEPATYAGVIFDEDVKTGDDLILTPDQLDTLHGIARLLVEKSLIETVRVLNFDVELPAAGARTLVPRPLEARRFPAIKSIAIVSTLGDVFHFKSRAQLFGYSESALPITDWNLDAAIEAQMRAALDPRFTVKPAPVDRAAAYGATITGPDGQFAPSFPGLPATDAVDAYLVAVKLPAPCHGVGEMCTGIGMWHWLPSYGATTEVFTSYALVLLDARTLQPLASYHAEQSPDRTPGAPFLWIGDPVWPDNAPALTPSQQTLIRHSIDDLIGDSIPETLLRMGLTAEMISPEIPAPSQASAQ